MVSTWTSVLHNHIRMNVVMVKGLPTWQPGDNRWVVQLKAGWTELSINIVLLNRPISTTLIRRTSGRSLLSITQKNALSHIGEQELMLKFQIFLPWKGLIIYVTEPWFPLGYVYACIMALENIKIPIDCTNRADVHEMSWQSIMRSECTLFRIPFNR